jgi:hypothetical protein
MTSNYKDKLSGREETLEYISNRKIFFLKNNVTESKVVLLLTYEKNEFTLYLMDESVQSLSADEILKLDGGSGRTEKIITSGTENKKDLMKAYANIACFVKNEVL